MESNESELQKVTVDFSPVVVNLAPKTAKWMGFVAYVWIISGAFTCLSIIGAVIGVPYILLGLKLKNAANDLKDYIQTNNPASFEEFIKKIHSHFLTLSIIFIAGFILMIIYIVVIILVLIAKGGVPAPGK
jgi:hypothetical protein